MTEIGFAFISAALFIAIYVAIKIARRRSGAKKK